MADFTDQDQEFLETLRKAYEKAASTEASRDPWQELFTRETTSEASRSVLAADVIKGFTGSWAASYNYGLGGSQFTVLPTTQETQQDVAEVPTPIRRTTNKLGRRGVPDVDFVPYNWGTNRFGTKGPALVGHPISFEVVGPTLKSPVCDWQWDVFPGGGANGGDLLVMADRYDGSVATCQTILEGYNIPGFTTLGELNEPNGGLYVIISDVGDDVGSMPPGKGSSILDPFVESFPYEVFRVVAVGERDIELHPNKPLSNYLSFFDIAAVRAVTFIQPYVTKLVAVPGSGAGTGREQTFVVVSPERAAQSDMYPPWDGGTVRDGTWLQGEIPNAPSTDIGNVIAYGGRNALPIPKAIDEGQGFLRQFVVPTPQEVGTLFLDDNTVPGSVAENRIVSIHDVSVNNLVSPSLIPPALGTYPVFRVTGAGTGENFSLFRVAEVNPTDGQPFFGPGPSIEFAGGPRPVRCTYSVHDPVSVLWEGSFRADDVDSARLTNLIDPRYVERQEKTRSDPNIGTDPLYGPSGANGGRSDRAIFNTRTEENPAGLNYADDPGNLMDLGFRMVLFPAKTNPDGVPIPDFDNPITSREAIIDASLDSSTKQFIDIDYSSGLVRLSVPPPPVTPEGFPAAETDINPNGNPGPTGNARSEVILFAACVPFSMEEGQIGSNTRVTGTLPGTSRDIDVFSDEVWAYVHPTFSTIQVGPLGFGPSAAPGNPVAIILDRVWDAPETGVIDILAGAVDGTTYGTWRYNGTDTFRVTGNGLIRDYTVLLGPQVEQGGTNLVPPIGNNSSYVVRLRREERASGDLADPTDDANITQYDTTYGSSARASALRFDNFRPVYEIDGSVTLEPAEIAQRWQQWGAIHPSDWEDVVDEPDLGLVARDRAIRSDGVAGEPVRFDENGETLVEVAAVEARLDGQTFTFEIPAPAITQGAEWPTPQAFGAHEYRLVIKFDYDADDSGANIVYYLGLVDASGGPSAADVALASPPLLASQRYIGMQYTGDPLSVVDLWSILVSDGTGNSQNLAVPHLNPGDPYYFVVETERDGYIDPDGAVAGAPYRLKLAVLDGELNTVVSTAIKAENPALPGDVVRVFLGARADGAVPDVCQLRIYYATLVTRKNLPGPKA